MFKFLFLSALITCIVAESVSPSPSPSPMVVKNLKGFVPFQKMEAENFSLASRAGVFVSACGLYALGYTYNDAWAAYYAVNFENGAELITFRLRGAPNSYIPGYIYLRLGSPTATPVATITVSTTMGADCNFIEIASFLPKIISGVQDLYLTFYSPTVNHIVDIDWFQFTRKY